MLKRTKFNYVSGAAGRDPFPLVRDELQSPAEFFCGSAARRDGAVETWKHPNSDNAVKAVNFNSFKKKNFHFLSDSVHSLIQPSKERKRSYTQRNSKHIIGIKSFVDWSLRIFRGLAF